MPINASGYFQRLFNWRDDRDAGVKILAERMDQETDGFAAAINDLISGNVAFKGPLKNVYGTAANPSYTFDGDPDSGLYRKSDGSIGVSVDGVEVGAFPASFFTGITDHHGATDNPHGVTAAQLGLEIGTDVQGFNAVLDETTASFTTPYETKLNNIEASADVTDATNVQAAGALMDSELSDIAAVKALDQGVSTSDSPTFAGLDVNGDANVGKSGTAGRLGFHRPADGNPGTYLGFHTASNSDYGMYNASGGGNLRFAANSGEVILENSLGGGDARLTNSGNFLVGKSTEGYTAEGCEVQNDGQIFATSDGTYGLRINRLSSDGELIGFFQGNAQEGSISVSGTTIAYNGGHNTRWSRFPGSDFESLETRPDIKRGTVMANLDEMANWRGVSFEVQVLVSAAVEAVGAVDEILGLLNEEGEVVREYVPAVEGREAQEAVWATVTKTSSYFGNKADGEKETVKFEGEQYEGIVYTEDNEQLNKTDVSKVKGDARVAGVFQSWDDDDDEYLNDFYLAMNGDFVIRIAKDCVVRNGDLLMSAGDGTACPQEGELADVVRSCTVAKVTSTHTTHTYDDGSYLVPCVLMAC